MWEWCNLTNAEITDPGFLLRTIIRFLVSHLAPSCHVSSASNPIWLDDNFVVETIHIRTKETCWWWHWDNITSKSEVSMDEVDVPEKGLSGYVKVDFKWWKCYMIITMIQHVQIGRICLHMHEYLCNSLSIKPCHYETSPSEYFGLHFTIIGTWQFSGQMSARNQLTIGRLLLVSLQYELDFLTMSDCARLPELRIILS